MVTKTVTEGIVEEVAFKITYEEWILHQHAETGRGLMEDTDGIKPSHDQINFFSYDSLRYVVII